MSAARSIDRQRQGLKTIRGRYLGGETAFERLCLTLRRRLVRDRGVTIPPPLASSQWTRGATILMRAGAAAAQLREWPVFATRAPRGPPCLLHRAAAARRLDVLERVDQLAWARSESRSRGLRRFRRVAKPSHRTARRLARPSAPTGQGFCRSNVTRMGSTSRFRHCWRGFASNRCCREHVGA